VASEPQILRRTALYDRHVAAGARLTPFAGWEMPVRYGSIVDEHLAVRRACGVFDVSHMGEIETTGPQAAEFLAHVLSNDPRSLAVGESLYAVLCTPEGGVIDDGITYRLGDDRYLTVTNAANHETDFAWFAEHVGEYDAEVADVAAGYAMLAVQGPKAREIMGGLAQGGELPARRHTAIVSMLGHEVLFCGTGYTGEDGGELLMAPEHAPEIWDALLQAGVEPVGLGARDTLRTEACLALYGNELTRERGPIEAGLGWCCTEVTGFIGSEAVAAVRAAGRAEKLVAFTMDGRGIARTGDPVAGGGVVTSGTLSPCLQVGIGMAYLPADRAAVGEAFAVDVRGTLRDAVVASRPLVSPKKET
jgi:aminomethyltransferase